MKDYNKGQIELERYPVNTSMPFGVSSGIKAKRCQKCSKIYFTNDREFKNCRNCGNA